MARGTRYHVVSKIARGGMAEIFLALQQGEQGFKKPVVLKRILPALAADPKFVRMFVDEAHIASTLNHSNLVQVLDLGKAGGQYFLVLEFVDGWSLEQVRRRARDAKLKLTLPLALYVVGALCRGLAYVHTRERQGKSLGIIHRDVTPQNVLISQHGEVKLADFGIAKAVNKSEKSATGIIKGKFAYMSPEQSQARPLDAPVRSVLGGDGALPPHHRTQALRRPDRLRRPPAGAARAPREALEPRQGSEPRRRAAHHACPAGRPRQALAERGADGGPHRRHPPQAGTAERTGAAQALARDAERARRRPAAGRRRRRGDRSSVAVDLGSLDLELEEVAATFVETDRGTGVDTHLARPLFEPPASPRSEGAQAARVAKESDSTGRPKGRRRCGLAGVGARFTRWVRRMTIRAALILVAVGGAAYLARPHLPAPARQAIDSWVRRLGALLAQRHP